MGMRVTPLEIRQQQFPIRFRGLDPAEVDKFLELVASDMEDLMRESARLKDSLVKKDQELQHMQQGEQELKQALMTIQQIRQDWIGRAEKEAEQVVQDSEIKAKQMVAEAERKLELLQQEMQALRRQKHHLLSQIRTILEQHVRQLESAESDDPERVTEDLQPPLLDTLEPPRGENPARNA
jgi:cell division initiation protein